MRPTGVTYWHESDCRVKMNIEIRELSAAPPPSQSGHCVQFSGTIPPELGRLDSLEGLHAASKQLSGTMPPELGSLASLRRLDRPPVLNLESRVKVERKWSESRMKVEWK